MLLFYKYVFLKLKTLANTNSIMHTLNRYFELILSTCSIKLVPKLIRDPLIWPINSSHRQTVDQSEIASTLLFCL